MQRYVTLSFLFLISVFLKKLHNSAFLNQSRIIKFVKTNMEATNEKFLAGRIENHLFGLMKSRAHNDKSCCIGQARTEMPEVERKPL